MCGIPVFGNLRETVLQFMPDASVLSIRRLYTKDDGNLNYLVAMAYFRALISKGHKLKLEVEHKSKFDIIEY